MKTDNDGEREHSFFTTLVIARTDLRGVTRNFHWFMGLQTSYPPLIGLHTSVSSQDFLLYFFHGETPARKQGFIFMDVKRRGVPLSSTGLSLNMDTMPCPTTQSCEKRWGPAQHSTVYLRVQYRCVQCCIRLFRTTKAESMYSWRKGEEDGCSCSGKLARRRHYFVPIHCGCILSTSFFETICCSRRNPVPGGGLAAKGVAQCRQHDPPGGSVGCRELVSFKATERI